jgi:O-antigen ligase
LSLIPLVGLVLLWLVPYLLRGGRAPGLVKPLVGFALLAVLSAGAAAFLPILPYKGQVWFGREARALATLAVGMGFYLCASLLPDTEERLRSSVRALYAGAAVALVWSTVQGWVVLSRADHVPLVITQIHHLFSVRDLLVDRVGGFAYEPSWLGNQLMVLYVPLLASATVLRQSVFPYRRGWLSIEAFMLLWASSILALTKSRISQISYLVLASAGVIAVGWRAMSRAQLRLGLTSPRGGARRLTLAGLKTVILVAVLAGLVWGASAAASRVDPRLWALPSIQGRVIETASLYPNDVVFALSDRLAFAERLVYWTAAFRTFSLHPILGVGPGNAGFFFEQTVPAYGLRLAEIQGLLREPAFGFPNPKNLWARLLAETGIVGFLFFGLWFISMGIGALVLWRRGTGFERYLGLAGVFTFLAQIIEGFSLDTYALPQLWLVFGLCTAALWRSKILSSDGAIPSSVPRLSLASPEADMFSPARPPDTGL